MGPRFVGFAAAFYAALFGLAVALASLNGRDALTLGDPILFNLVAGVITACGTVASGLLLYRLSPTIRRISDELAPLLVDVTKRRNLVLVSAMSGVGEEALFRGALQPILGIVITSILFGALHIGPDRRYLTWTLWAVGAGFLFGFLYEWTGGLAAPMTAHVLHNAATLLLWKRSRQKISSLSIVPGMARLEERAASLGSREVIRSSVVVCRSWFEKIRPTTDNQRDTIHHPRRGPRERTITGKWTGPRIRIPTPYSPKRSDPSGATQ